ncbi:MAG: redoxin family protein [Planctomycetes bacterium]|nr:redoxin family protein [Planctomycetota bacterium]
MHSKYAWLLAAGTAAFFSVAAPIAAQDMEGKAKAAEAADEKADAVVDAWKAYNEANETYNETYKKIVADYNAKKVSLEDARAQIKAAEELMEPSKKAFIAAVRTAEWKNYSGEDHAEMLESGLFLLGQDANDAEKPEDAIKAFEALLELCPSSKYCSAVQSYYLPGAYIDAGQLAKAVERVGAFAEKADDKAKPSLLVKLGDLQAATGDTDAAVKSYQGALDAIGDKELGARDPLARTKGDATTRKKLVGQTAPNVDSETWIGGEAKSLADMKGKVVIIDFWATWCPPCRGAMPGLDEIYKEHKEEGVVAIGLTHYYKSGFLPTDSSDLQKGERVDNIAEEDYVAHVTEFKKLADISYPFVIGKDDDFKNYGITGIPQMVVVDKEGKVALLVVGGGNEKLVGACVKALLEKKETKEEGKTAGGMK